MTRVPLSRASPSQWASGIFVQIQFMPRRTTSFACSAAKRSKSTVWLPLTTGGPGARRRFHRRTAVRLAWEAGVRPGLEARADHRRLDAAVAVDAAAEHEALLADARVPAVRGLVAVEVLRLPLAVGRGGA